MKRTTRRIHLPWLCLGLALGLGLLMSTAGCTTQRDNESALYSSHHRERIFPIDLYDTQTSGVHSYERARTAGVDGQSPMAAGAHLLNPQQQAAIAGLQHLRAEREKNGK